MTFLGGEMVEKEDPFFNNDNHRRKDFLLKIFFFSEFVPVNPPLPFP